MICTSRQCLRKKGFNYELITEFTYKIIMSKNSPLAKLDTISTDDLADYIEIAHADPYVPSVPVSKVVKEELSDDIERRIFVFERTSQFELLTRNLDTFMWVSPIPQSLLDRYDLVQKECNENRKVYKDLLIYKNGYKLSKLICTPKVSNFWGAYHNPGSFFEKFYRTDYIYDFSGVFIL